MLDVGELCRKGVLKPGVLATFSWSRGGRETGSVGVCSVAKDGAERVTAAVLIYQATTTAGVESIRETVPIEWTPCRYGGARPWFVCPGLGCGRRVLKLYGGRVVRFLCRHCLDLTYTSRREPAHDRALQRAQAIRQRLGGSANMVALFPWKPKGMHWQTYERLRAEHDAADAVHVAHLEAWLAGTDRFLAGRMRELERK